MSILSWLVLLPLLGAGVVLVLPAARPATLRLAALLATLATAAVGVAAFLRFDPGSSALQFAVDREWFRLPLSQGSTSIRYHLGLDGISLLMVALTAVLMPVVVLSSAGHVEKRVKEFLVWMLVMETGMLGVFLAQDLVLFYFAWEISLVPLYFVIGIWGGERRLYATLKFFLYTLAGSLVMLVAVLWLIYARHSADLQTLSAGAAGLGRSTQTWLFLAFALAFAIKVPLLPFHTWLADAHTEAPTSGSVVLAGVLLKMGTYGLLRFCIGMFPDAALRFAPLFLALGALGIVYGALLAMAQDDLKRLVACSSVSHLGFVVLGLFSLNQAGLRGGVIQMVNHGVSTGLLFLLVGMIYERRHTRLLHQFGGLALGMPIFALVFTVAVLSSVGLPGLNGFVGEYLILLGAFGSSPLWAAIGVSGVVLGAIYLLSATRRLLYGPIVHEANRGLADLRPRELVQVVPLLALAIWMGVQPGYFLSRSSASIDALLRRVDASREMRLAGGREAAAAELSLTSPGADRAEGGSR